MGGFFMWVDDRLGNLSNRFGNAAFQAFFANRTMLTRPGELHDSLAIGA